MIHATDCILIMGRRGCGKSFLAKRVQEIFPRRVVIDTLGEYSDGEIVRNFPQFCAKMHELKRKNADKFVVIYQFPIEGDDYSAQFNEIMRICFYFGNLQIVIEEVQNHSSPQFLPGWLRKNLLVGRHQNVSLLFTSQRPGEVHKTIVSQCSHIFCGNLIDGNDIRYVSNFLNQNSEKLINLPNRKFIYFHDGKIQEISNDF